MLPIIIVHAVVLSSIMKYHNSSLIPPSHRVIKLYRYVYVSRNTSSYVYLAPTGRTHTRESRTDEQTNKATEEYNTAGQKSSSIINIIDEISVPTHNNIAYLRCCGHDVCGTLGVALSVIIFYLFSLAYVRLA